MMKGAVAIVLFVVVATAYAKVAVFESPVTGYHDNYGVPKAESIRQFEEQLAQEEASGQRIVGGMVTDITAVPFQAGLIITLTDGRQSVCGGTLFTTTRIITAAHCQFDGVNTARVFNVVLGSNTLFSGGTRFQASSIVTHPQWNHRTTANDIAVLRFNAISFSVRVQPVDLPTSAEASNNFVGSVAVASGFGFTHDGAGISTNQRLSSVNLPVVANTQCSAAYGSSVVHDTQVCTSGQGGRNICNGDSGGPLIIRNGNRRVLVGVISYGAAQGCMAGFPSVSTRVGSYLSWILAQ